MQYELSRPRLRQPNLFLRIQRTSRNSWFRCPVHLFRHQSCRGQRSGDECAGRRGPPEVHYILCREWGAWWASATSVPDVWQQQPNPRPQGDRHYSNHGRHGQCPLQMVAIGSSILMQTTTQPDDWVVTSNASIEECKHLSSTAAGRSKS